MVNRNKVVATLTHFAMTRVLDGCYRAASRLAYPLAMLWWCLCGNIGIALAVWVGERVLLVRHSYKPGLRLPSGSVRSGEDHCLAARELQEEVGLVVPLNDLHLVGPFQSTYGTNYLYEISRSLCARQSGARARSAPARISANQARLPEASVGAAVQSSRRRAK